MNVSLGNIIVSTFFFALGLLLSSLFAALERRKTDTDEFCSSEYYLSQILQ